MIDISARYVISSFKDMLLPDGHQNYRYNQHDPRSNVHLIARGLRFSFDIRISASGNSLANASNANVQVLVVGNHKAFVKFGNADWVNVGNHDSCWIDSVESELRRTYFDMCDYVNAPLPKGKKIPPRDMNQFTTMDIFNKPQFVEVALSYDLVRNKEHGSSYWYQVDTLRRLTMAEFMAYEQPKG